MAETSKKLTLKQQAFVLEYPIDFNATQAAIRAGYSKKTAYAIGYENLRKPEIAIAIDDELEKRTISLDEVMARISAQATSSISDFFTIDEKGDRIYLIPEIVKEQGHLIKKMKAHKVTKFNKKGEPYEYTTIELELYNAQSALEMLAKHRGALRERIEHSGEVNIKFKVEYGDPDNPSKHPAAEPPLLPAPDTKQSGKKKGS